MFHGAVITAKPITIMIVNYQPIRRLDLAIGNIWPWHRQFVRTSKWVKIVHTRQRSFVKCAMVHLIHLQDPTIKGHMTFMNCKIVHLSHPQDPTINDTLRRTLSDIYHTQVHSLKDQYKWVKTEWKFVHYHRCQSNLGTQFQGQM